MGRAGLGATLALGWGLALAAPVALLGLAGAGAPGAARAANSFAAVRTVNGAAVTGYDIGQRVLLLEALGATGNLRETALKQLTEDRLKEQSAKGFGVELTPEAIEQGLEEFATQRGITSEDVLKVLEARKIDRQTLDDFIRAGLLWREVVGGQFRKRAIPTDAEVDTAIAVQSSTPREMLQLAEIALPFAERGEAETQALAAQLSRDLAQGASFEQAVQTYSRSASAEQGGLIDPLPAANMPPAIRSEVLTLRPGQVSRPIPISGGIALLKLVSIDKVAPEKLDPKDPQVREAVRGRLFNERITAFGQGYLQELMTDALIVDR